MKPSNIDHHRIDDMVREVANTLKERPVGEADKPLYLVFQNTGAKNAPNRVQKVVPPSRAYYGDIAYKLEVVPGGGPGKMKYVIKPHRQKGGFRPIDESAGECIESSIRPNRIHPSGAMDAAGHHRGARHGAEADLGLVG